MFDLKRVQRLYELLDQIEMSNNWKKYIDHFLFNCKLNNLTKNSINNYAERLIYFIKYFADQEIDIEDITRSHIQQYIISLIGNYSDATVNGRIQCIQRFFNLLEDEEFWTKPNPMKKIKKIRAEKRIKDVITEDQISRILTSIYKKDFYGYRNYAMLLILWDSMIRRNEMVTLKTENVNLKSGIIKVYGKGRKEREIAIGSKMIKTLHFYLVRYRNDLAGKYVFCTRLGNKLDKNNASQIIVRLGTKVGIHITPHLIRHSACTWFIRNGGSSAIAQRIMGHTSPIVTDGYTHLNSDDIVKAYMRFSPANAIKA